MKSLFVVMQGGSSPIAIVIPSPKAVFQTRKEANAYILKRANSHLYYVRKVENMLEKTE